MAIGIDLLEEVEGMATSSGDDKLAITFMIAKPELAARSSTGGPSGGGAQEPPFFVIGAEGHTFLEAIENAKMRLSRSMYFGHLQVFVISEGVARQHWDVLVDELMRDPDVSSLVDLLVAKEQTAREVLVASPPLAKNAAEFLTSFRKKDDTPGVTNLTRLWDFYRDWRTPGRESGAASVTVSRDQIALDGSAVFKGAGLVGWLGPQETVGFNLLTNQFLGGTITVPYEGDPTSFVVARDLRSSADVTPVVKDLSIAFQIRIFLEGNIGRMSGAGSVEAPETFREAEGLLERYVKQTVEKTLSKLQLLGSDITDFGEMVHKRYPDLWKVNNWDEDWNEAFRQADMQVEIETKLRGKGLTR